MIIHRCPRCGAYGMFGYRNPNGDMIWYCARHQLGQHYADARRDGRDARPPIAAEQPVAPDLQVFIKRFGGCAKITAEGWVEWDRLNSEYQKARRVGLKPAPEKKQRSVS